MSEAEQHRLALKEVQQLERQLRKVRETLSWTWDSEGTDSDGAWELEEEEAALVQALSEARSRASQLASAAAAQSGKARKGRKAP